jgi:acetolactate synthase I/II/III large subunit
MARRCRVVDYIVEFLAVAGVDYIFGVDGANIEHLYEQRTFGFRCWR